MNADKPLDYDELPEEPIFSESLEEGQEDPIAVSPIEQTEERPIGIEEQKTVEQQEKYSKLSTPSSSSVSGLERQVTSLSNQLSKQSDVNRKTLQELKSVQLRLSRI